MFASIQRDTHLRVILWIAWLIVKENRQRGNPMYMAIYVFSLPLLIVPFLFVFEKKIS